MALKQTNISDNFIKAKETRNEKDEKNISGNDCSNDADGVCADECNGGC